MYGYNNKKKEFGLVLDHNNDSGGISFGDFLPVNTKTADSGISDNRVLVLT